MCTAADRRRKTNYTNVRSVFIVPFDPTGTYDGRDDATVIYNKVKI